MTSRDSHQLRFESFLHEKEVFEVVQRLKHIISGEERVNKAIYGLFLASIPLSFVLSAFVFLVPLVHGIGGWILHRKEGWKFYQPGKGGSRFMALNGVGWFFFSITLLLQIVNIRRGDFFIAFSAFMSGLLSLSFILSSLLAFQSDRSAMQLVEIEDSTINNNTDIFNSRLKRSVIMHSGENPSGLFWVLIGLQLSLCAVGGWFLTLLAFAKYKFAALQLLTAFFATACFTGTTPVTHVIGGKWKNYGTDFSSYQPFSGGKTFVTLQALGWSFYGLCQFSALLSFYFILQRSSLKRPFLVLTSCFGLLGEGLVAASLFYFEGDNEGKLKKPKPDKISERALNMVIRFANFVFAPSGNWQSKTRRSTVESPEDWKNGEERFRAIMEESGSNVQTGEQYLIVGCGFVGKRLVRRLLDRGETKIRVFDLNPNNPFPEEPNVEYIVGNVTKFKDIYKACKGVDTVYATFALIRFMDRLKHQAAISYIVNVVGTEVLYEAIFESAENSGKTKENPLKVIITSSSHATTDELSLPRTNRTEEAPYVTKKTAHNHYGWTKALADKYALNEGSNKENVKTTVVRPCSGVFGGDDRTSMQKCLDMGVAPGIGSYCEMDWVYVENVVLGHLLAEQGLIKEVKGELEENSVNGQAFNISNDDATTWIDFWHLVKDTIDKTRIPVKIEYCFVPMKLIWATAYFSEGVQRVFRGKVKLGQDLDSLTPAMLQTATMSYTYKSEKANKVLGYSPAYTLDEGVQKGVLEYHEQSK